MGLAVLYEVPDADDMPVWSFSHAAHHVDINRFVMAQTGVIVPSYILDPHDPGQTWIDLHQAMHTAQNAALGLSGYDLTSVDWGDRASLAAWISMHADEHARANTLLGIP